MPKFGSLPRSRFTPPPNTRGGGFTPNKEPEAPLKGVVQNQKAAQGEERLSRTLNKAIGKGLVREYKFRWTTLKRGTVGYKEADFVVFTPARVVVISVQGTDFIHRSARSKNQDKINDLIILSALKKLGYNVHSVDNIAANDLKTQEDADKQARKLGLYR